MKRYAWAAMLLALPASLASAQPAAEPGLQTYRIGDLPLESGEVIRDFSIAYMTAGTLNAAKGVARLAGKVVSQVQGLSRSSCG